MISSILKTYLARQYAKLYPKETFVTVASGEKTVLPLFLVRVLSQRYSAVASDSIQSTILQLNPGVKRAVLEAGRGQGEMDLLLSLIQPKVAVFSKASFGGDRFLAENKKLVNKLQKDAVAVVNCSDIQNRKILEDFQGQVIYYGLDSENCTVWAGNPKIENFGTTFELNLGVERVKVNLSFLGENHIFSSLAAAAVGILEDIPLTKIKIALESITPLPHQMQVFEGPVGSIILDDNIDCNPASMDDAINSLLQIPSRRKIAVLGEMKDLGSVSEHAHRQLAQKIYKEKIDLVFLGQGGAQIIADELQQLGFWEDRFEVGLTNSQMVSHLLKVLGRGDVCLVKGSGQQRLDEVVKRVAGN